MVVVLSNVDAGRTERTVLSAVVVWIAVSPGKVTVSRGKVIVSVLTVV